MIRTTALAMVSALVASCAPAPYQSYQTYDSNGYPVQRTTNPNNAATVAAVGLAGLAAYGYLKERGERKDAQRDRDYYRYGGSPYYRNSYQPVYGGRGRGYRGW